SAAIIVNTSSNPASGERLTLSRQQGTVWSVAYTDTGRTGYYNITAINVTDSVGNRNETRRTLARFHVVNHSITASLGGGQLI
ncbi:MAG: hypothetical protein SVU32_02190, partial [Candidatus Nanohaloarchaea archaeon]|nr:hypothetical protein [Candidatus Nanohaloarchaea archaeon]